MKNALMTLIIAMFVLQACSDSSAPTEAETAQAVEPTTAESNPADAASETAQSQPQTPTPAIDLSTFDTSVRPQDDLYMYVNGAWMANTEIPADKSRYGAFIELRDRSREAVRDIIQGLDDTPDYELSSEGRMIRDFYASYMDIAGRNQKGLAPVQPELDFIANISSKDELAAFFASAAKVGVSRPVSFFVNQDFKNPTSYIVYFSQSGLGMPSRDYYFDEGERSENLRAAYLTYLTRLNELAGLAEPAQRAQNVMDLETRLAEPQWTPVQNRDRDATYNKVTQQSLQELAPQFPWPLLLKELGIADQKHLIVRQPTYLSAFADIFAQTDLEVWKQYMTSRLLASASTALTDEFYAANFDFYQRALSGVDQKEAPWKRGINMVNGTIGELVGKLYVKEYFPPEAKSRMDELVTNLRKAMSASIANLDWMSAETKAEAQDKLSKFTTKIGYPDEWRDYSSLNIQADNLVGNLAQVNTLFYNWQIEKLGGPINPHEWYMNPQTVNAYYNPPANEIVFPAAILQPPFFNLHADDAVNYGGIGVVIGHEIGHGFDDQGRKSDGDGVLRDWWTQADGEKYEVIAARLVDQFNEYQPVPGKFINGELTLGENIGDLGGITLAWRAYQLSLEGKEAPAKIDGYTDAQRFFLSFAQIWRNKQREEATIQRLKTDPHSPPRYRVLGTLPNFDPFYDAFDVQPGDALYRPPEQRIRIW